MEEGHRLEQHRRMSKTHHPCLVILCTFVFCLLDSCRSSQVEGPSTRNHKISESQKNLITVQHINISETKMETEAVTAFADDIEIYSRRPIYIRGHLLEHRPSGKKTFHPPDTPEGYFRTNNSIHLQRVLNFRKDSDSKNTSNRQKRKHIPNKERFHNYKMLLHSKDGDGAEDKKTDFYFWVFGAAILGLGALTTVTASVLVFCKIKREKSSKAKAEYRENGNMGMYEEMEIVLSAIDDALVYQRVEGQSTITDQDRDHLSVSIMEDMDYPEANCISTISDQSGDYHEVGSIPSLVHYEEDYHDASSISHQEEEYTPGIQAEKGQSASII